MNNAIRTQIGVINKGKEPPVNEDPAADLTINELLQESHASERWCGGRDGWDNYVERWH